ncbi:MAG: Lar family restriction alleviation protein [Bacillota bacterium]
MELKPCPFCGGQPTIKRLEDDVWYEVDDTLPATKGENGAYIYPTKEVHRQELWRVSCLEHGVFYAATKEQAIAAWNRRVPAAPKQEGAQG